MTKTSKAWRFGALILAVLQGVPASAQPGGPMHCFADWSAAATVVDEEKLVTVEDLSSQFSRLKLGEIVKTQLCREGGVYVYRLVVRAPNGRFKTTLYDARRGIEIGVAGTSR